MNIAAFILSELFGLMCFDELKLIIEAMSKNNTGFGSASVSVFIFAAGVLLLMFGGWASFKKMKAASTLFIASIVCYMASVLLDTQKFLLIAQSENWDHGTISGLTFFIMIIAVLDYFGRKRYLKKQQAKSATEAKEVKAE